MVRKDTARISINRQGPEFLSLKVVQSKVG